MGIIDFNSLISPLSPPPPKVTAAASNNASVQNYLGPFGLKSSPNPVTNYPDMGAPSGDSSSLFSYDPANPNYQVRLTCHDRKIQVKGYLPDSFRFQVTSGYSSPFSGGLGIGSGIMTLGRVAGIIPMTQTLTSQLWAGSEPLDINMGLIFYAYSDPDKELVTPIANLTRLSLPYNGHEKVGGATLKYMESPGPHLALKAKVKAAINAHKSYLGKGEAFVKQVFKHGITGITDITDIKNRISMSIGKYMRFPLVVILGVSQDYPMLFDKNGRPMAAQVSFSVRLFQTPLASDVSKMYGLPASHTGGGK